MPQAARRVWRYGCSANEALELQLPPPAPPHHVPEPFALIRQLRRATLQVRACSYQLAIRFQPLQTSPLHFRQDSAVVEAKREKKKKNSAGERESFYSVFFFILPHFPLFLRRIPFPQLREHLPCNNNCSRLPNVRSLLAPAHLRQRNRSSYADCQRPQETQQSLESPSPWKNISCSTWCHCHEVRRAVEVKRHSRVPVVLH